MISIDGLAVEFGGTTLFSDISFVINEKDRIALMGKNGAGKSTLLKVIAGVFKPTEGKVVRKGRIVPLLELGAGFNMEYPGRCKTTYPWKNLSPQRQCHSLPSTAPYDGRRTYRIPGSGASLCPPA